MIVCDHPFGLVRLACIDIGSNTTRLLVAEVSGHDHTTFETVLARRVFLPLTGVETASPIALRRLQTLEGVVAQLAEEAAAAGVSAGGLRVVATQSLRLMPTTKRDAALRALSLAAGAEVELLSTQAEAELAFSGATAWADHDVPVAVIDIGGGSSELIVGTPGQTPDWWCSVPLGSRTITERWLNLDPPTNTQIEEAVAAADGAFSECVPPTRPACAWTVGGGTQSLARLLAGKPAEPQTLSDSLKTLSAAPAIEVAAAYGLDELRTRVLPATLVLLIAATRCLGCAAEPGSGGLREGIIHGLASTSR
jgi:exopolyphosphatase/guanosine-5'-triphosphate,3'-diphosphate pyrophosphatase